MFLGGQTRSHPEWGPSVPPPKRNPLTMPIRFDLVTKFNKVIKEGNERVLEGQPLAQSWVGFQHPKIFGTSYMQAMV